ncbi:phospholipase A2 [Nocardia transvalensis]|uniref:phospholipase A2 n=1 Tax=Nocardia transvalensis TaxID=37333 RepID=UPI001895BCCB|nr:phospholipase A2 [Nocardia transvalensis]MBF6326958.1 hypothetical protein [Nocardia transvalensis]
MRNPITRAAVVAAAAAATVLSGVVGAGSASADDLRAVADNYMNMSADDFANAAKDPRFDWSTDGCSGPTEPIFANACLQHDFGYRNYGNHGALKLSPTAETKEWIDGQFLEQMRNACGDKYPPDVVGSCIDNAQYAWQAVHSAGGGSFF